MSGRHFIPLLVSANLLLASPGCVTFKRAARHSQQPPAEQAATVTPEPAPSAPVVDILAPGYQLEAAEKWPEAMAFYAAVLKEQPANATALHRLGVISTLREDHEAAASYYRRAMELDPRNAALLADAGYFLSLQREYETAALMLEQAILLDPANERAVNNYAMVQGLRGEIDAALVLFRRVNPPAVALQSLASIHEQRGEWQLALACYHEAHSVDPSVAIPEAVLSQVEQLRQGLLLAELSTSTESVPAEHFPIEEPIAPPVATSVPSGPPPSHPIRRSSPVPIQEAVAVTETNTDEFVEWAGATTVDQEAEAPFFPADAVSEDPNPEREALVVTEVPPGSDETAQTEFDLVEASLPNSTIMRPRETALDGCCPVALRDTSQLVDGRPEFCLNHAGVIYALSSAEAVQRFRLNPERYIPSAGGLDVISVRSGKMERGSLHFSTWFRNRLFLFNSAEHVDEFRSDPLRYVDLD